MVAEDILMRVSGHDAISERTEKSSRFVLTVAAIVLLVEFYKVPIGNLTFLGVNLPEALFKTAASAMMFYALINFILHWAFDVYAWNTWYENNKVETTDSGEITIAQYISIHLNRFTNNFNEQKSDEGKMNVAIKAAKFLMDEIPDHNKRLWKIGFIAWIYIGGLHFLLPVGASVVALWSIWISK